MKQFSVIYLILFLSSTFSFFPLNAQVTSPSTSPVSEKPSIAGFEFGLSIDSIYTLCKQRFGEEYIEQLKGGYDKNDTRIWSDSTLLITKHFPIFDDSFKTANYTLLNFQKNNSGELTLSQIAIYTSTAIPWDWEDILDMIYDSYFDYLTPQYIDDYEEFINDDGLKAFRFGKDKYCTGSWYGLFNIIKGSQGYMLLLTYMVPQYPSFPLF